MDLVDVTVLSFEALIGSRSEAAEATLDRWRQCLACHGLEA